MKYKIGVYGSAINESDQTIALAKELGHELAKQGVIVVTGACSGMPYIVAFEAKQHGSEIWGFSPQTSLEEHKAYYTKDDVHIYDKLFFVPQDYTKLFSPADPTLIDDIHVRGKYRNVISTTNVDAGIIVSGRWGTMHEFCSLYDMGKIVGVLTSTGGIADEIQDLQSKINKKTDSVVVYDNSPKALVEKVLAELDKRSNKQ